MGFVAMSGDVMKASAAGPFFSAAFNGLEEFIAGRVEDFERFIVFPDLCQSGLLERKAVFSAYLLDAHIAESPNPAAGFPGGLPERFDEVVIGDTELKDPIGIALVRRSETGREVPIGNI
jgi:hypothetical protein